MVRNKDLTNYFLMIVLWYFCPEIPNFLKEKKCLLKVTAILPEDWMICKYYRAMHVTVTSLTPTMTDLKEQLSNHWSDEWCQEWWNYPEYSAPKLFERMTAILVTGVLLESVRARQSTSEHAGLLPTALVICSQSWCTPRHTICYFARYQHQYNTFISIITNHTVRW